MRYRGMEIIPNMFAPVPVPRKALTTVELRKLINLRSSNGGEPDNPSPCRLGWILMKRLYPLLTPNAREFMKELYRRNPKDEKGHRKYCFHQLLDQGHENPEMSKLLERF